MTTPPDFKPTLACPSGPEPHKNKAWFEANHPPYKAARQCSQHSVDALCPESNQVADHAARVPPVTPEPRAFLLAVPGLTPSLSRPPVSDDNPYSESQFRTLKCRPDFPPQFESIEAARLHCRTFVTWYNDDHRYGGLGLRTPTAVHHGHAHTAR